MSESSTLSISSSVDDDSTKGKFDDAKAHKNHHHSRETHGLRDDIGVETPITDVKAPNVFERAKEEIEAIVEAIHPKKEVVVQHDLVSHDPVRDTEKKTETKQQSSDSQSPPPEKSRKSPNIFEKAKQDIKAKLHKDKPIHHHKETHGRSDDIDENTPVVEVKGPNVFERAKEEFEAVVEALHPKKDSGKAKTKTYPKKESGLGVSIGRKLEKICSPGSHNDD